jgi:hypothetical protein
VYLQYCYKKTFTVCRKRAAQLSLTILFPWTDSLASGLLGGGHGFGGGQGFGGGRWPAVAFDKLFRLHEHAAGDRVAYAVGDAGIKVVGDRQRERACLALR